jgi:hypothetical protein
MPRRASLARTAARAVTDPVVGDVEVRVASVKVHAPSR